MAQKELRYYEQYPLSFVLICNLLSLSIYGLGIYIIAQAGLLPLALYVLYILFLEYRLLRFSCRHCCYYGKMCAFGKGKLCSLFFKKGNPKVFLRTQITWKSLIPDLLVSLVPILAGIALLLTSFDWLLLGTIVLLFLLSSTGNAVVRGSLACKYCKQRKIGCPAEKLFHKK